MNGLYYGFQRMALNPLQSRGGYDFPLFKETNPLEGWIVVIGVGTLILVSLIIAIVRNGVRAGEIRRGQGSAIPKRFSSFKLRRLTSSYGLDKYQTKLLEFVFRNDAVSDPERVLKNPVSLDKHFKRAYRTIEKSANTEDEAQQRLSRLFTLRNAIEAVPETSNEFNSTSKIPDNTAAVISTGKDSYTVRVLSAKSETLLTELPRNVIGTPVRLGKGTKLNLSFFTKSSKGFMFETRIVGTTNTLQGPALELAHSGKPKPLVHRRFRRKQINEGCIFNFVFQDGSKASRKKPPKLVVDSRRFAGTILDISAGGCSIKSSAPVQVGSRIKIDVSTRSGSKITVLGQVLRTNRSGTIGTVIHVKFIKVPRRSFNNINAMVFGYNED